MNHCVIQPNTSFAREEMRREAVVCPKPRRLGLLTATVSDYTLRPLRWQIRYLIFLSIFRLTCYPEIAMN